jgi:hypothetical protein
MFKQAFMAASRKWVSNPLFVVADVVVVLAVLYWIV